MSALDKLRRLRDRLVDFCGIRDRGYDGRREFSPLWVLDEIDRLLAEPETPEPASAPANGIEIVGLPAGTIKHERTERGTVRLLFTPAPPLTGPNYLDQEEWGHERGAVSDSSWDRCVFRHADGRGVYVESSDVIRGDDVPSVVRLRLTGDMGPGTVFEYEIKPDERAAVPTDAEVEDAIESFEDATHIEARHGVDAALFEEFNAIKIAARDALRALIARRVAAATDLRKRLTEREDQVDDLQQSIDNITLLARLRGGGA